MERRRRLAPGDRDLSLRPLGIPAQDHGPSAAMAETLARDGAVHRVSLKHFRAKAEAIGIGGSLAAPPLPHHRTYGSVYGGSRSYANALRLNDSTRVGWAVRGHSPPRAIRCLPATPAGLHPSAPMRSPVSTGCSAACRSRDSCPTCLSSRSGLQ